VTRRTAHISPVQLNGHSLIGGEPVSAGEEVFCAVNPATGEDLLPTYHTVGAASIKRAGELAAETFATYGRSTGAQRAVFLRGIAAEIEEVGDILLECFTLESGLPRGRAEGERARTCDQLRMFADLVAAGTWCRPVIDPALPERKPQPRPELRSMLRPIGPVAVFGPANFPLAFGVAGGDTASALAAGCPVIVKAHSSHPCTSEIVGHAVVEAARRCGLPPGVFALLFGGGRKVGQALVRHPAVRGVGFTGSKVAGRELFDLCANRPVPIPFFGELSSINPVCLLPGALAARPSVIATSLAASVTLGCGQFCTNPGLVLYIPGGREAEEFVTVLTRQLAMVPAAPMLNAATRRSYAEGLERTGRVTGVETLLCAGTETGGPVRPALFRCPATVFRQQSVLHEEIFGPATLLVTCRDMAEMVETVGVMEGQLTATVHQAGADLSCATDLLALLEQRVGRLIFDGYPTGVEVCPAMVHSGPWPASTDSRFTSVGPGGILRWVRPICWQNAPAAALPGELGPAASA